jgi:Zn-dependent M28 family amino/carboxypeptidase
MLLDRRVASWPRALFISLAVITLCCVGRLAGVEATWFTIIQFIPTVVLIALTPVFADTAISATDEGAADNAAGVAAALRLAESHSGHLTHFDLMLVFPGASAHFGLGMREWLKRHRKELDPQATAVISLDNIAGGEPAYAAKESPVFAARMHPTLVEIAAQVGGTAREWLEVSDSYLARSAGLPALRVGTTADGDVDADAFAEVCEFTGTLLDRIDDEIGPRLT